MKYRKKPVVIEAMQFDGNNTDELRAFVPEDILHHNPVDRHFYIETLEGDHRISNGDYVIKGIKGEFYPCKPDIFEATYEGAE